MHLKPEVRGVDVTDTRGDERADGMRHEEAVGEGRTGDVVEETGGFEGGDAVIHGDYWHVHHALGEVLAIRLSITFQTKFDAQMKFDLKRISVGLGVGSKGVEDGDEDGAAIDNAVEAGV